MPRLKNVEPDTIVLIPAMADSAEGYVYMSTGATGGKLVSLDRNTMVLVLPEALVKQ